MQRLLIHLRNYRRESVLAPLLKLAESLMDLFVPLVVASIIDKGIAAHNMGLVQRNFALLVALAALGMGFSFAAQWMAAKASVGFATDLRQALFDHIQHLSYRELDALGTDTLITRMTSDINQVQTGLNLALRLLLRSPFIVFGALACAFLIDVRCAMVFAVAIPLLLAVVFGIMLASIPLFSRVQTALDALLGITRENLTGVRVIRAFRKEADEIDEFDNKNNALTRLNLTVGRLSALMNPATYLIVNLATIVLLQQGAWRVEAGVLSQGDVVALYNYMAQIVVELVKLASLIITINRSLACARRVEEILAVESSMRYPEGVQDTAGPNAAGEANEAGTEGPHAGAAGANKSAAPGEGTGSRAEAGPGNEAGRWDEAVRFCDVSLVYTTGAEAALAHIDFAVHRGQTIGVIGGTGSGKTSLVNLVARLYDATDGQVCVYGRDVRSYPEGALISRIGIVPQKAVLFEGTVRDNLLWGNAQASDAELWEALTRAQAAEVVRNKDGGLDARIEQGGRNLSGGQRQRLTIARALVRKPEILILDDSASALDFATDLALRRAIAELDSAMTVFIVSQRTSSVRHAHSILVLDDGQLAGVGTHDELMSSCAVYQEIYYSQFPDERPRCEEEGTIPDERPRCEEEGR